MCLYAEVYKQRIMYCLTGNLTALLLVQLSHELLFELAFASSYCVIK